MNGTEIQTMGKLIVFEGVDGSGKSTQYKLMCDALDAAGVGFQRLVFPQYSEPSSALIRMYLAGEFGTKPSDVNAYAASAFFAVDRYASYKKTWGGYYADGGLIVTDRYTTSNAVHQASKLPENQQEAFFRWLSDFEYDKLGLPQPDAVIFLDVDAETSVKQLRLREEKNGTHADIHEKDADYLAESILTARRAAAVMGWHTIKCNDGAELRSVQSIHNEIMGVLEKLWTK